jgi:FkbM family methyltransferase
MTDPSSSASLRSAAGRRSLQALRLYTFHSPVRKGKLRLARFGMRFAPDMPGEILVPTTDGRRLHVDLSTGMCDLIFFLGEYERAVTRVVSSVVRPGDVCLDVGANMGWYTTLLHELAGPRGEVHAFEPVPGIFRTLKRNVALLDRTSNVHLRNVALGDKPGEVTMHLFAGLPDGHASMSDMDRDDYETVDVPLITLDSYLDEQRVGRVDFVKTDIEGAELMFLRGAERLFAQDVPPVWMIEMALGTTKGFGYRPDDLVRFMQARADYDFYAVDDLTGQLHPTDGFAPEDIGANVLCMPASDRGRRIDPDLLRPFPRGH